MRKTIVAIVGPCSSGKSTLREALILAGYDARQPAQEHSYVQSMWQQRVNPDVLIFLDLDYETAVARRRKSIADRLPVQHERLAHARAHADLYIDTSALSPEEIRDIALRFLDELAV